MKKTFLLLSFCALLASCNSNSSNTANESAPQNTETDSSSSAAMSAATRQSDADTNSMNIGTDRAEGTDQALAHAEGAKLIASSDCTACHSIDQKLVGPAYVAVAQKYENNAKDTDYLASKIIQGGKGVWGEIPMTPHPNLSQEDAKAMAQYILSLKK